MNTKNIVLIICLFVFFVGCSTSQIDKLDTNYHLVENCRVYDKQGKLIKTIFNGTGSCYLNDDGSVLFSDAKGLSLYDANFNFIWRLEMLVHHMISKTKNGDYLVLASENHPYDGKIVRFDRILRISEKGKIVGEFNVFKRLEEIEKRTYEDILNAPWLSSYFMMAKGMLKLNNFRERDLSESEKETYVGAVSETYHFNSVSEITEMKELNGNVVVSPGLRNIIIILSPDLSQIVHIFPAPSPLIHDVYFKNEQLVIYNNEANFTASYLFQQPKRSAIQLFDYPSMSLVRSYGDRDSEFFYAEKFGGGSLLPNGNIVFSHYVGKTQQFFVREVDTNGKMLHEKLIGNTVDVGTVLYVKVCNMSSFLSKNKWNQIDL